jgi:hypothetical protein
VVGTVATCQRATLSTQPNAFIGETKTRVLFTWASTSNIIKWALEQKLWLEGSKNQLSGKLDLVQKKPLSS